MSELQDLDELKDKIREIIIKVYKLGRDDSIYNADTPIISYVYDFMQLIQQERVKAQEEVIAKIPDIVMRAGILMNLDYPLEEAQKTIIDELKQWLAERKERNDS